LAGPPLGVFDNPPLLTITSSSESRRLLAALKCF